MRDQVAQSSDICGHDNFPTGCSFSPDGSCVLTATCDDGKFRLYDTPRLPIQDESNESNSLIIERHVSWKTSLSSHEGGPPPPSSSHSYAWYPGMTSCVAATACYLTCRGASMPTHLVDAYTSAVRASYRYYNGVDEMEGPSIVCFGGGSRVFAAGFRSDRVVAAFDVSRPGRECQVLRLGKTRRSMDGQKGILSALSFPGMTKDGAPTAAAVCPPAVFAIGTYSPASIYIYDDRAPGHSNPAATVLHGGHCVLGHGRAFARKKRRFAPNNHLNPTTHPQNNHSPRQQQHDDQDDQDVNHIFSNARIHFFQSRARGGITQLTWCPSSSPVLYSASRHSNAVLSWDVRAISSLQDRHSSSGTVCGLQSYARDGETNQRLEFDFDSHGKHLFVGSNDGTLRIYDVKTASLQETIPITNNNHHRHAVNGVSYFDGTDGGKGVAGYKGLLAVAVGSRQFDDVDLDEQDDDAIPNNRSNNHHPGFLRLYAMK